MADYDAYDEATLQQMANDAESYEERSAIRQALRRKKKGRGENVGRSRPRGNSVYNRFAGSTAPAKQVKPKNFVIAEGEAAAPARPPSTGTGGSGRGSSRGSTTPTQRESTSSPVTRPRSPTPPPTPEQEPPPATEREEEPASTTPVEDEGEEEKEEVDIEPAKEEEAPPSPPPSPQQPDEPSQPEEVEGEGEGEGVDGTPVAELPEQLEEEPAAEEEREEVVEEERAASPEKEEPVVKEEQPVHGREEVDIGSKGRREEREPDSSSGGARFGGVTLRSRRTDSTPSQKSVDEPQNEFLSMKLRQTSRDGPGGRGRKAEPEAKVDFGVKLKTTPREKPPVASPPSHKRGGAGSEPSSTPPRTLKDYQELSGRSAAAKMKARRERDEDIEPPSMEPDELQKYLVAYVNSELSLHPPLPVKGGALFETCSNPTNLCKLVNKSVANTVDLRALTKISSSSSEDQKREALKENMTLALESARAIGCRVSDDSGDNILNRHPQTIRDFLVDLIRAKAVNLPGMDDEPSSTFTNMATLFEKLHISVGGGEDESVDVGQPEATPEETSWRDDREKVRKALESPSPSATEKETWREKAATEKASTSDTTELSYEERAAMRRAQRERERKAKQAEESGGSTELSYEERAAQRRADRERRRREREALAK